MKSIPICIRLLCLAASSLPSCGEKGNDDIRPAQVPNSASNGSDTPRVVGERHASTNPPDPGPAKEPLAEGKPSTNPKETHGDRWQDAIDFALRNYKGAELHGYLYSYADSNAAGRDFDRIGFLKKLQELHGPGSHYSSLATLIYSKPIELPASTILKEISELDLSQSENEMILSSALTGGAVVRASSVELKELLRQYDDETFRHAITSAAASALGRELSGRSPEEVANALSGEEDLGEDQKDSVVERLVKSDPALWWEGLERACVNTGAADVFTRYSSRIADGLLPHKEPEEIIGKLSESYNTGFSGAMAGEIAARWVATDSGAVARWAAAANPGPVRDEVVRELVRSLRSRGFNEDAEKWAQQVED